MRVVWSPAALDEIERIYRYIATFNPAAAAALAEALLTQGDGLVNFPHRGRPVGDNLREIMPVYPYLIRYEVTGDTVQILRVRHGMRRQ